MACVWIQLSIGKAGKMSDVTDDTDALIDALHAAACNGGRLFLPHEIVVNGLRHDAGIYELKWVGPMPIDAPAMEDPPF